MQIENDPTLNDRWNGWSTRILITVATAIVGGLVTIAVTLSIAHFQKREANLIYRADVSHALLVGADAQAICRVEIINSGTSAADDVSLVVEFADAVIMSESTDAEKALKVRKQINTDRRSIAIDTESLNPKESITLVMLLTSPTHRGTFEPAISLRAAGVTGKRESPTVANETKTPLILSLAPSLVGLYAGLFVVLLALRKMRDLARGGGRDSSQRELSAFAYGVSGLHEDVLRVCSAEFVKYWSEAEIQRAMMSKDPSTAQCRRQALQLIIKNADRIHSTSKANMLCCIASQFWACKDAKSAVAFLQEAMVADAAHTRKRIATDETMKAISDLTPQ